jgi:hypothetical protein
MIRSGLNHCRRPVASKRALLRTQSNVYDAAIIDLLSCLHNVHGIFENWDWQDRFASIARSFGLSSELVKPARKPIKC